jgi:ParB-like chromosome segregation protein Spo0J
LTSADLQIIHLPIDDLVPYARNSRTHSEEQVEQIAASITEFGFTNPVLIDSDGGIIAGHGRVMAARKLGLLEVPCLELAHLTDAQKRAYVIADNKLATNADWDSHLLALEVRELMESGLDIDLLGFNADELRALMVNPLDEMPGLPSGDKSPFQQMTFTLHDTQAEQVREAMKEAAGMGPFVESENENSNGNALARICETFLTQNAQR